LDENRYVSPADDQRLPPTRLLGVRLCVMMFLQYFVQGCYLPIISVYLKDALGFDSTQIGAFGSALAVGPLLAPFVIGQLVDRHFSTEKVLSVCHACGGLLMLALYWQTNFWVVVVLGTLYSVLYVPSMMLTNSLAMHHLPNRDRQFPLVRLFGTIGFIVPAWLIEPVLLSGLEGDALNTGRGVALALSGGAGIVMAVYCLLLPHTPPQRREGAKLAPVAAMGLMRYRNFLVLVAITFFVALVHKFYFVWNGPFLTHVLRSGDIQTAWEQRISSLGQISEIGVMAGLGLLIARIGFKWTMVIGAAAYTLRCLIFAGADALGADFSVTMTLACVGQVLHGFCFGCFLAAAFMYVDRYSPTDIRGSVQNLYGTLVIGLGFFAGGLVSGRIGTWCEIRDANGKVIDYHWTEMWLSCALLAAVCMVAFALLFPRDAPADNTADATSE